MANIKSQIKRAKQAEVRHNRNKDAKSALKTLIKKFNLAVDKEDKNLAETSMKDAVKALDKSVSRGIIHKNNAANKKSGLAKRFLTMPEKAPVKVEEQPLEAETIAPQENETEEKKVAVKKVEAKKETKKAAPKAKSPTVKKTPEKKKAK